MEEKQKERFGLVSESRRAENRLTVRIDHTENELLIDYSATSDRVIFDICDFAGSVLETRQMDSAGLTKHSIKQLSPGVYTLYVLDGEKTIKHPFEVN